MAARLQLSAPEVTDLSNETAATQQLYDIDDPGDRPVRSTMSAGSATGAARCAFRADLLRCGEHDGEKDSSQLGQPRRSDVAITATGAQCWIPERRHC